MVSRLYVHPIQLSRTDTKESGPSILSTTGTYEPALQVFSGLSNVMPTTVVAVNLRDDSD